jgi:hypothetical protein
MPIAAVAQRAFRTRTVSVRRETRCRVVQAEPARLSRGGVIGKSGVLE